MSCNYQARNCSVFSQNKVNYRFIHQQPLATVMETDPKSNLHVLPPFQTCLTSIWNLGLFDVYVGKTQIGSQTAPKFVLKFGSKFGIFRFTLSPIIHHSFHWFLNFDLPQTSGHSRGLSKSNPTKITLVSGTDQKKKRIRRKNIKGDNRAGEVGGNGSSDNNHSAVCNNNSTDVACTNQDVESHGSVIDVTGVASCVQSGGLQPGSLTPACCSYTTHLGQFDLSRPVETLPNTHVAPTRLCNADLNGTVRDPVGINSPDAHFAASSRANSYTSTSTGSQKNKPTFSQNKQKVKHAAV